jgi:hypothetical protein
MLLEIRTGWPKENETGVLRDHKHCHLEHKALRQQLFLIVTSQ